MQSDVVANLGLQDLDGDGVLSRRDFQVPGGIEAGDMDEAELNHLTMVADADANSEVSWDEMAVRAL